jgi:hypothetical protein
MRKKAISDQLAAMKTAAGQIIDARLADLVDFADARARGTLKQCLNPKAGHMDQQLQRGV